MSAILHRLVDSRHTSTFDYIAVGVVWLGMQAVCGLQTGVTVVGDAARYLGGARELLQGDLSPLASGFPGMMVAYAAVLAVGGGTTAVAALQVVLSGLAAVSLIDAGKVLYSPRAGVLVALLYVGWWEIQRRNFFLLTTSLYVSLGALLLWAVLTADSPRRYALAAVLGLMTASIRPEGTAVALPCLVFLCARGGWQRARRARLGVATLVLVLAAAWLVTVPARAGQTGIRRALIQGTVVHGSVLGRVDPPALRHAPQSATATLTLLLREQPRYLLELSATRIWYFLTHVKPYYSTAHNAFIRATYYPVFLLAALGLAFRPRIRGARVLLVGLFLVEVVFVALTFEDWSGRWLLHAMPPVFLLAAGGLQGLASKSPNP